MKTASHFRIPDTSATEPRQSEARRAAEAFFAPPPATSEPSVKAVTIRRKKTLEEDEPTESPSAPNPLDSDAHRLPKVHRVSPAANESAQSPILADGGGGEIVDQAPALAAQNAGPKRRRRLHGEVTIIRPNNDAVKNAQAVVSPDVEERTPTGEMSVPIYAELEWPLYPKLLAKIKLLETEAQRTRKHEVTEALRRIKQAMESYGISAQDLDLP